MSTEFSITGEITYRRTREATKIVKQLFQEIDDDACEVTLVKGPISTLEITGGYTVSWHSSSNIPKLLEALAPFAEGAGSFDCEQEGESWTIYVGSDEEVRKLQSKHALTEIDQLQSKLNDDDRRAALKSLRATDPALKQYVIEWEWESGGRFGTGARMTAAEARALELMLEARCQDSRDISDVVVAEWEPVHQDHRQVFNEIMDALGDDTCRTCLADLNVDDGEGYDGQCGECADKTEAKRLEAKQPA